MRRVLGTFLYYMRWQRVMAWTTGIGAPSRRCSALGLTSVPRPRHSALRRLVIGSGTILGGPLSLDANGDPVDAHFYLSQIKDGKYTTIAG